MVFSLKDECILSKIVDLKQQIFGRCPVGNQLIIEHVPLSLLLNHRCYNMSRRFSGEIGSVYSPHRADLVEDFTKDQIIFPVLNELFVADFLAFV